MLLAALVAWLREKRIRRQKEEEDVKKVDATVKSWDQLDGSSVSDDDPDLFSPRPPVQNDSNNKV